MIFDAVNDRRRSRGHLGYHRTNETAKNPTTPAKDPRHSKSKTTEQRKKKGQKRQGKAKRKRQSKKEKKEMIYIVRYLFDLAFNATTLYREDSFSFFFFKKGDALTQQTLHFHLYMQKHPTPKKTKEKKAVGFWKLRFIRMHSHPFLQCAYHWGITGVGGDGGGGFKRNMLSVRLFRLTG